MENEQKTMACTHCGSLEHSNYSWYEDKEGVRYRNFKCRKCGRNFCEKPRKYSFEQKRDAIDRYMECGSNKEAAEYLGCSPAQIVKWRREFADYGLIDASLKPRMTKMPISEQESFPLLPMVAE